MKSNTYKVTITGESPLLMHADNYTWSGRLKKWQTDPGNKGVSVKGDDRSPAWAWIGSLYTDAGRVVIPSDNLMTVLREGGAKCPTGKGQATFKRLTQSGLLVNEIAWTLITADGRSISTAEIEPLLSELDFEKHEETARALGFELFVKRARIGASKHIRVRPRFAPGWSATGTITVLTDDISLDSLSNILKFGGAQAGIGDWRPSSPRSPGAFGRFLHTLKAA